MRKPIMDDPAALELLDTLQDKLRALAPESEAQHWLKSGALQVSGDLAQVRWKLAFQNVSVIPHPFLIVVASPAIVFRCFLGPVSMGRYVLFGSWPKKLFCKAKLAFVDL